jgi:hypothetical protein
MVKVSGYFEWMFFTARTRRRKVPDEAAGWTRPQGRDFYKIKQFIKFMGIKNSMIFPPFASLRVCMFKPCFSRHRSGRSGVLKWRRTAFLTPHVLKGSPQFSKAGSFFVYNWLHPEMAPDPSSPGGEA